MEFVYESKDEFVEKYNDLKSKGMLEIEIARELLISSNTLLRYKHKYGIELITPQTRELINDNGLSKEMLTIAKENGLNSSIVNQRIRNYKWSVEDACTIPILEKGGRKSKYKGNEHAIRNK